MEFLTLSVTDDNVETFLGGAFFGADRVVLTVGSNVFDSDINPEYFVIPVVEVSSTQIAITIKLQTSGLLPGIYPNSNIKVYVGAVLESNEPRNYITPGFLAVDTNSYCDLEYADGYHATKFNSEGWFSYSQGMRERAMVGACNLLETVQWVGEIPNAAQTLQWPRVVRPLRTFGQTFRYDMDINVLGIAITPVNIKSAQSELAYQLIRGFLANQSTQVIKIGPLNIQGQNNGAFPTIVMNLISDYVNRQVKVVRT